MTLTPVTEHTITLPRLCGTREQAAVLIAGQGKLLGKTILISARLQTVGTPDYADGLIGALMPSAPQRIVLVGHTRMFSAHMVAAAARHACNVFEVLA